MANPQAQVTSAFAELEAAKEMIVIAKSSLYKNPPIGFRDQPDFINATVKIETKLSAVELLKTVLAIEEKHHRIRCQKNGPRSLDIDLLLYGNEFIQKPELEVPHPRMKERPFVIFPLLEIESTLVLPCGTPILTLATTLASSDIQIVGKIHE